MTSAKTSYRKNLMRGRSQLPRESSIVLMNNLDAQTTYDFKEYTATRSPGFPRLVPRMSFSPWMQAPNTC